MTSLGSKVVSNFKKNLADITTEAILTVADLKRKDVNFELIKINGKTGGFKYFLILNYRIYERYLIDSWYFD